MTNGTVVAALLLAVPQVAFANPGGLCGTQTTDGLPGTADTITCDPNESYPDGIVYGSDGDLTLEVLPNDPVDLDVAEVGVDVTNSGAADNLFWDSGDFTAGNITGTGIVLDYLSDTGNVDILVGGDILGTDDATHAIRAESTGGGTIDVTTLGVVQGGSFGGSGTSGIGIEALTTSGDIIIDAQGQVSSGGDGGQYAIHAGSSAGGNITINTGTAGVSGRDLATHGILAETTGTGNITIDAGGSVSNGHSSGSAGAGGIAIEATTGGGDIAVTAARNVGSSSSTHGIVAETTGAGTLTLNLLGGVQAGGGGTGIRAVSGSGNITIDTPGVAMRRGAAIETQSDGLATINLEGSFGIRRAYLNFGETPVFGADTAIRGSGGGSVVVNVDRTSPVDNLDDYYSIAAPFDFSGLGGGATVNFGPFTAWWLSDQESTVGPFMDRSVFSPAADTVNIAAEALLALPMFGQPQAGGTNPFSHESTTVEEDIYRVEFGDGADVVNNAGTVIVGPLSMGTIGREPPPGSRARRSYQGEIRLEGLAEFNNSGTIWLGASLSIGFSRETGEFFPFSIRGTDFQPDDIFAAPGAAFHGDPGSRIVVDADLSRVGQSGCNFAARTIVEDVFEDSSGPHDTGDLANDCVDLSGSGAAATGRTEVFIQQMIPGDRGAYIPDGNVIVDLAGSDPAATDPDAFVIAPDSTQYSPDFGGVIDKGLFLYRIAYDAGTQQFKLYGIPSFGGQRFALLGEAANRLWHTAADGWFDRRLDQRDVDMDSGYGGGVWFHASRDEGERDALNPVLLGSETVVFDNSYQQDDTTLTIGGDLISRNSGEMAWVVGLMGGYARSDVVFETGPANKAWFRGMHVGAYGSFTFGDFFLDAAVNQARLDMDYDVPRMNLRPAGTVLTSDVTSTGAKAEGGWRWRTGWLAVEPLVGFSYVTSSFDDTSIPADDPSRFGGEVSYDDPTSSRGSLGVRLTLDDPIVFVPSSKVGLTARAIEEFDGESKAFIGNVGPLDAPVVDTLDGTFGQVTADVSLANAKKNVAGYLKVDGMFHDDYESLGVSAGFRYQW